MVDPALRTSKSRPRAGKRGISDARKGLNTSSKATIALTDPDKPLTDLERMFVKLWASGESPSSAAARTGMQNSYAYRLTYKPNVLKAYRIEKEAYEAASGMNRKRVIDGFLEAIEMAKTMADPGVMVAGWREVGKMCGYYEPVEVKHTVNVQGKVLHEKIDRMTDAELYELMEKRMAQMSEEAGAGQALLEGNDHGSGIDDANPREVAP